MLLLVVMMLPCFASATIAECISIINENCHGNIHHTAKKITVNGSPIARGDISLRAEKINGAGSLQAHAVLISANIFDVKKLTITISNTENNRFEHPIIIRTNTNADVVRQRVTANVAIKIEPLTEEFVYRKKTDAQCAGSSAQNPKEQTRNVETQTDLTGVGITLDLFRN